MKMKTRKKQKKGISLIVLVITIIIMLILAGAIILALNNSGAIGRATEATDKSDKATLKEAANVAYGEWTLARQMDGEIRSADEYVKEKLKDQGFSDEDLGLIYVDDSGKISTAIVPEGFVASDIEGENTIAGGLVIYEGTEKVSEDADAKTTRNQFVWIPVDISEFTRTEWSNNAPTGTISSYYTEPYSYSTDIGISETNDLTGEYAEYKAMKESVEKYGGFYIGRYEAGSETERTNVANGTTNMVVKQDAYVYNYVGWGPSMTSAEGDVTYDSLNQGKGAVELSRSLYKNSTSVKSTLIYGVQWDAALRFIADETHNVTDSTSWGNYYNNTDRTQVSPNNPAKTGAHENWKAKNIYDLAGNIREWTMTASLSDGRVQNGDAYYNNGAACAQDGTFLVDNCYDWLRLSLSTLCSVELGLIFTRLDKIYVEYYDKETS